MSDFDKGYEAGRDDMESEKDNVIKKLQDSLKAESGELAEEQQINYRLRDDIEQLEARCDGYAYIGKRLKAQDGHWVMLHAGAMAWVNEEFDRLAPPESEKKDYDGQQYIGQPPESET